MGVNTSVNMLLPIPQVGNESGPTYAQDVNNCLTLVDQHNHSPGYGVLINPNGMYINADLPFNDNNLTTARSIRFQSQGSPLSTIPDIGCLYEVANDLYYNDGLGNQIRITSGGGLAGTPGSITNMVPPAAVTYVPISQTFVFTSALNTPANIDVGFIVLRNNVANSPGLTLEAPFPLVSDYSITLPFLPASNLPMSIDENGIITAAEITPAQLAPTVGTVPTGGVIPYFGTSAPTQWLLCDGASYLRSTYPALFAVIGTSCGAADGTHFNVPDLRGQFIRGVSGASSRDPDASSRTAMNSGGNTGNNVGSIQADGFKAHDHQYTSVAPPSSPQLGSGSNFDIVSAESQLVGGAETRPINAYANYIIRI